MLALHGLDVVGLELSPKGAAVARAYAKAELAAPRDYNFGSGGSAVRPAGEVQIIAGDFFTRDWEAGASVGDGFDLVYDYTVSIIKKESFPPLFRPLLQTNPSTTTKQKAVEPQRKIRNTLPAAC